MIAEFLEVTFSDMARASYSTTPLLRSLVHRPQGVILVVKMIQLDFFSTEKVHFKHLYYHLISTQCHSVFIYRLKNVSLLNKIAHPQYRIFNQELTIF